MFSWGRIVWGRRERMDIHSRLENMIVKQRAEIWYKIGSHLISCLQIYIPWQKNYSCLIPVVLNSELDIALSVLPEPCMGEGRIQSYAIRKNLDFRLQPQHIKAFMTQFCNSLLNNFKQCYNTAPKDHINKNINQICTIYS